MSACRLGSEPVNRLTRQQCDKLAYKAHVMAAGFFHRKQEAKSELYSAIHRRIINYKNNLNNRGL